MRKDLRIDTGQVELDAWHYLPQGSDAAVPTIIMSFGFSGLKAMGLDKFAEVFAAAGLGALVYDHRGFGTSTGAPAREVDPWVQIADMRDVITFASTLKGVDPDRIGLWGTSYAGLLQSGHYDVYWRKFDEAALAARDWFADHLLAQHKPAACAGVLS